MKGTLLATVRENKGLINPWEIEFLGYDGSTYIVRGGPDACRAANALLEAHDRLHKMLNDERKLNDPYIKDGEKYRKLRTLLRDLLGTEFCE